MGRSWAEPFKASGAPYSKKCPSISKDSHWPPHSPTICYRDVRRFPISASTTCKRHHHTRSSALKGWAKVAPSDLGRRLLTPSTTPLNLMASRSAKFRSHRAVSCAHWRAEAADDHERTKIEQLSPVERKTYETRSIRL